MRHVTMFELGGKWKVGDSFDTLEMRGEFCEETFMCDQLIDNVRKTKTMILWLKKLRSDFDYTNYT